MPELSAEPKVAGSRVPEAELPTEPSDVPAAETAEVATSEPPTPKVPAVEAPAMTASDGERDAAGQ